MTADGTPVAGSSGKPSAAPRSRHAASPEQDLFQALRAQRPHPAEYHWEPCCFCGLPIRTSATEPCRLLLETGVEGRTRQLSEYWCHESCFRSRMILTGALAGVRRDADGAILNATDLSADDVVGERVLCPGCRQKVFVSWPEGWDAHAAHRCSGVAGRTPEERKASFKDRFGHLFR